MVFSNSTLLLHTIVSATMVVAGSQKIETTCGTVGRSERIVRGNKAGSQQLPWMVWISVGCGGTLISDQHVLTAAHCKNFEKRERDFSRVFVAYGDVDLRRAQRQMVRRIYFPESYGNNVLTHDLMILELMHPIELDSSVNPICLSSDSLSHDTRALVSGWGRTEKSVRSFELQFTAVTVQSAYDCQAEVDREYQYCAAVLDELSDTCVGDSGSPLFVKRSDYRYYQYGVLSSGSDQCGFGGVYVRVDKHLPFIKAVLENSTSL